MHLLFVALAIEDPVEAKKKNGRSLTRFESIKEIKEIETKKLWALYKLCI